MSEFIYCHPSHNLGADLDDLDLNRLETAGFAELRQALRMHKVLFIREQNLSIADLERVTLQTPRNT